LRSRACDRCRLRDIDRAEKRLERSLPLPSPFSRDIPLKDFASGIKQTGREIF
jgi:hypothetical protein